MRVGVYWHIFPTFNEAKNAVWMDPMMLFNIIPPEFIKSKNETELLIEFVNGSLYYLKGADKPERLLGAGPFGVVHDEFQDMKVETWTRITQPIIRANGGWAWFIGTPKGKNHLFDLHQYAKGDDPEWETWLLKASTSGIIAQDQLKKARLTTPEALYNQEYECEFLEGADSVFKNMHSIMDAVPQKPLTGHLYVIGCDLAKLQDFTVITVYDRETNAQVFQDRFQTLEWPYQKQKIGTTAKHYNNALVMLDATGIGDPIADDLIRAGVAVEPIKLTNQSKKDIIEKLSIWIEQRRVHMINIEDTKYEFDNYKYEITSTGLIRYGGREGYHDDIVMAHALAVWGLQPQDSMKIGIPVSRIQIALKNAVRDYNQDQEDDSMYSEDY